jgi:hypoxanthine phosphoribosyltransferase
MVDTHPAPQVLLSPEEISRHVEAIARKLAPELAHDAVAVCLLIGGLWFAADLTRALARLGCPLAFEGLWLTSYGDATTSAGRCDVRAGPQRSVSGRHVLIMDDVIDSGLSLAEAARLLTEAGATRVTTVVFARKPWPGRVLEPDHVAWEAPSRFLVGYGMDLAGGFRGLPYVGVVEPADELDDLSLKRLNPAHS